MFRGFSAARACAQAQYGDDAVKEHRKQEAAAARGSKRDGAVGDVNQIPLGQRPAAAAAEGEVAEEPEQALDPIPDVEWWDARLLRNPAVRSIGFWPHIWCKPSGAGCCRVRHLAQGYAVRGTLQRLDGML